MRLGYVRDLLETECETAEDHERITNHVLIYLRVFHSHVVFDETPEVQRG